jgi:hypothetical protein
MTCTNETILWDAFLHLAFYPPPRVAKMEFSVVPVRYSDRYSHILNANENCLPLKTRSSGLKKKEVHAIT